MRTIEGQDGLTEIEVSESENFYFCRSTYDREVFADIVFQVGPVKDLGPNGCFVEDLLKIVIDRLERNPKSICSNIETAVEVLARCRSALFWLDSDRKARGVEGKEEADY